MSLGHRRKPTALRQFSKHQVDIHRYVRKITSTAVHRANLSPYVQLPSLALRNVPTSIAEPGFTYSSNALNFLISEVKSVATVLSALAVPPTK